MSGSGAEICSVHSSYRVKKEKRCKSGVKTPD